jgi:hypothetical protein
VLQRVRFNMAHSKPMCMNKMNQRVFWRDPREHMHSFTYFISLLHFGCVANNHVHCKPPLLFGSYTRVFAKIHVIKIENINFTAPDWTLFIIINHVNLEKHFQFIYRDH